MHFGCYYCCMEVIIAYSILCFECGCFVFTIMVVVVVVDFRGYCLFILSIIGVLSIMIVLVIMVILSIMVVLVIMV